MSTDVELWNERERAPDHRPPIISYQGVQYTGPSLTERAIIGAGRWLIKNKGLFLVPALFPIWETTAAVIHYAPHYKLAGGITVSIGFVGMAFSGMIAMATAEHAQPVPVVTHQAPIHGSFAGGALALGIAGVAFGVTILTGPLDAFALAAGVFAMAAATAIHVLWRKGSKGTHYVRKTDRIRARAEYAEASIHPMAILPGPISDHPAGTACVEALYVASKGAIEARVESVNHVGPNRYTAVLSLPPGVDPGKVLSLRDALESTLHCRPGGLTLSVGRVKHHVVFAVNNVAPAELPSHRHPMLDHDGEGLSIWDPIYLGDDAEDQPVYETLAGTPGIFVAAEPRHGKSVLQSGIVLHVVRAPDAQLWSIDASQRELVIYERVAARHVGADIDEAIDLLKELIAEIGRRGELLGENGKTELTKDVAEELDLSCIFLVIDELAYFTAHDDTAKRKTFCSLLRDAASRGGAVGVSVIPATQKPENEIVPSFITNMITRKAAGKCATIDHTNTVLGKGMAKQCPAHEIGYEDKGVFYVVLEGRPPMRIRTRPLSPEQRIAIVDAYADSFEAPQPPPITPPPGDRAARALRDGRPVLQLVPKYPDGRIVEPHRVALWKALANFPEGFTYRDVLAEQLPGLKVRSSLQTVLDVWRGGETPYVVEVGQRGNAAVFMRADLAKQAEDSRVS